MNDTVFFLMSTTSNVVILKIIFMQFQLASIRIEIGDKSCDLVADFNSYLGVTFKKPVYFHIQLKCFPILVYLYSEKEINILKIVFSENCVKYVNLA